MKRARVYIARARCTYEHDMSETTLKEMKTGKLCSAGRLLKLLPENNMAKCSEHA